MEISCSAVPAYRTDCALMLAQALVEKGFGPFFGTPCGILAPLYSILETEFGLHTIPREDNAIGIEYQSHYLHAEWCAVQTLFQGLNKAARECRRVYRRKDQILFRRALALA